MFTIYNTLFYIFVAVTSRSTRSSLISDTVVVQPTPSIKCHAPLPRSCKRPSDLQNNIDCTDDVLLSSSDESFVNKLLRDTPTAYHDTTTLVNQASATSGSINNKVSSSNTSNLPSFSKPLEPRKKTKPTNSSSSCDYSFDDTPISKSNSTSSDDCNQMMMTQILEMQKTLHMLSDANVKLRAEIDNSKKEQQQNSSMEEKSSSASSRKRTFMSMHDNYQSAEEPEQLFSSSNQPTSHYWQHYHSSNNDEPAFPTTGAPSFPNLSDTNNYRRHQESRNDRRAGFLERQRRCFSFYYYLSQLLHL